MFNMVSNKNRHSNNKTGRMNSIILFNCFSDPNIEHLPLNKLGQEDILLVVVLNREPLGKHLLLLLQPQQGVIQHLFSLFSHYYTLKKRINYLTCCLTIQPYQALSYFYQNSDFPHPNACRACPPRTSWR